jgi:hypothetical protein
MRPRVPLSGRAVAALLAAASAPALGGNGTVSFRTDVLPILTERCVMCHVQGAEQGNLRLYPDAWAQLVGAKSTESALKRVEPGAPEKSYLYLKLLGTHEAAGGSGARMPFQQDPLSPAELERVRVWILEGAGQD